MIILEDFSEPLVTKRIKGIDHVGCIYNRVYFHLQIRIKSTNHEHWCPWQLNRLQYTYSDDQIEYPQAFQSVCNQNTTYCTDTSEANIRRRCVNYGCEIIPSLIRLSLGVMSHTIPPRCSVGSAWERKAVTERQKLLSHWQQSVRFLDSSDIYTDILILLQAHTCTFKCSRHDLTMHKNRLCTQCASINKYAVEDERHMLLPILPTM
jgi:hypothetical protein